MTQPPDRLSWLLRHGRSDRGSVAVEAAVIAPALVALMLLVVFAGRVSEANGNVQRAASEAARAASLEQNPTAAKSAAMDTAKANLATAGTSCQVLRTDVDTRNLVPGGTVTVEVTCQVAMSDVALLGLPGTRTFHARSVEVVDRYRSDR